MTIDMDCDGVMRIDVHRWVQILACFPYALAILFA